MSGRPKKSPDFWFNVALLALVVSFCAHLAAQIIDLIMKIK